eukprot:g22121.t1
MDSDYWESYYARSLQRRGGSLRSEDCYCDPDSLMPLLPIHHGQGQALLVGSGTSELPQRLVEKGWKSIWEMSTHDLPGSVAYLLKLRGGALDVQTFPCWASIIDLSAESVHLRVSLTAEQRRSLQLSTDGHVARVQRPETDEVFELSLPWHQLIQSSEVLIWCRMRRDMACENSGLRESFGHNTWKEWMKETAFSRRAKFPTTAWRVTTCTGWSADE